MGHLNLPKRIHSQNHLNLPKRIQSPPIEEWIEMCINNTLKRVEYSDYNLEKFSECFDKIETHKVMGINFHVGTSYFEPKWLAEFRNDYEKSKK